MTTRQKLLRAFASVVEDALAEGVPVRVLCDGLADAEELGRAKPPPLAAALRAFGAAYEAAAPGLIGWEQRE